MVAPQLPNFPSVMFTSARVKLTIWYLFIIMVVSVLFSFAIYTGINTELQRFERLTMVRREDDFFGTRIQRQPAFDPTMISGTRNKLILTLVLINLGIFITSGISGYVLAGKTLKPIEDMVEDQKRFIADASHELRTPLTAMKTEIEVALRDKSMTLADAKKLLKSNLEEADKMQSLSNYLLSLSRYQNNTSTFPLEKFSLTELLKEVVDKLQITANAKDIVLKTEMKEVEVSGNRDSLRELFTILVDNAIKYSGNGKEVIVKAVKKDKHAVVQVQDFGVGIKASEIPHIFDRFYRADSSRSKSTVEGYGLGLSIAKSIVDLHHGKIDVKSTPGQGTTFTVMI